MTYPKGKAEILKKQFCSVFTQDDDPGPDQISPRAMKYFANELTPVLQSLLT